MAKPTLPKSKALVASMTPSTLAAAAQVWGQRKPVPAENDRRMIAQPWQVEAYRQVNICGEARYAATLFAAVAGRAEIGIAKPQTKGEAPVWVNDGPAVDALAEIAPDNRTRKKLIRDYMLHRVIAGECYLIARDRYPGDPGYVAPPGGAESWDDFVNSHSDFDVLEEDGTPITNPNEAIWEIVAVTEIRKTGDVWSVRLHNGNYVDLKDDDPVIRLWQQDPGNRNEAWSPYRSLLPTLREIEWLTAHIFKQVQSRLMSAGVWFVPNNITFPPPPPESVEGGETAIATMNEAQQFMMSLAAASVDILEPEEVSFPSVVMADPLALEQVDQSKLIKFWSEIDDAAMTLRSDAVRRFALGMDMPPEQVLGASGMAVSGSSGSTGSVNHWGVWANEEQTITAHIEPALDDFCGTLTISVIRLVDVGGTDVVGYDTSTLRMRQDRSAESLELYDRGLLTGTIVLRENGFDPEADAMGSTEFHKWLLVRLAGGSATPAQVTAALKLLEVVLPDLTDEEKEVAGVGADAYQDPHPTSDPAPGLPTTANPKQPGNRDGGKPQTDHDHNDAAYSNFGSIEASCEALVLRALEKNGNRLLNSGKRGRDRDRETPAHLAHLTASATAASQDFDFALAPILLDGMSALTRDRLVARLANYCAALTNEGRAYERDALRLVVIT